MTYPPVILHSYWTWLFIVDLPIKNGDFPIVFCMFTRGYHYGKHFLSELFNLDGAGSRWVEAWAGPPLQSLPNDLRLLRQPLANFAWSHKYHGQSKVFLAWPYSWQSTLQAESWHRWSQMRFSIFRLFKHYSTCPHEVSHIFPQRSFIEPPKQKRLEAQYASGSKTTSPVAVVSSYWCSWGLLLWVEPWYLHQWNGCPITSYHVSPGAGWVPHIWWLSSAGDTHWGMRRVWEQDMDKSTKCMFYTTNTLYIFHIIR
jgi:hypothetical protein